MFSASFSKLKLLISIFLILPTSECFCGFVFSIGFREHTQKRKNHLLRLSRSSFDTELKAAKTRQELPQLPLAFLNHYFTLNTSNSQPLIFPSEPFSQFFPSLIPWKLLFVTWGTPVQQSLGAAHDKPTAEILNCASSTFNWGGWAVRGTRLDEGRQNTWGCVWWALCPVNSFTAPSRCLEML